VPDAAGATGAARADRYSPSVLKELVAEVAQAAGCSPGDARLFADALVEADVYGGSTHGVSRLGIYLRRMRSGLIDPRAELRVEQGRAAVMLVDAGSGLGQVQAMRTLERLEPVAREHGVAAASVRSSGHFGTLAYYCAWAARRDMILIATTNAEPAMAPYGASEAVFGTNPIGAAFPTGLGFPVTVDLATSIVARGNIIVAARRGEPIPTGWAVDAAGNPTTDAEAALAGAVLTMAGHKGYALAFLVEILSGVLSGAAFGTEVGSMYKHMDRKQNVGHFFCLLDIAAFMDVAQFKERIDALAATIKGRRKLPGVNEIFLPGEIEHRASLENRRLGVKLDQKTVQELEELCAEHGLRGLAERQADEAGRQGGA
jgi:LDH2 family malate/lactate/ureidoglycolate dehydrogenase